MSYSQEPTICPIHKSPPSVLFLIQINPVNFLPPLFILFLTRVFDIFFHLHLGGYYFKMCKHIFMLDRKANALPMSLVGRFYWQWEHGSLKVVTAPTDVTVSPFNPGPYIAQ